MFLGHGAYVTISVEVSFKVLLTLKKGVPGVKQGLAGIVTGVLAGSASIAAGAETVEEMERRRYRRPPEWRVRVSSQPLAPKQGLYSFSVQVRDQDGRPVNDAEVYVRLHSFDKPGYRLVRAAPLGRGSYQAHGNIKVGLEDPRAVRAVVRSGSGSTRP